MCVYCLCVISPSIASTVLSLSTSMEPEQTKYMACRASPWRIRNSPGAQKEVLMMSDRERRHPRLADSNRGSCSSSLFRCMAMSARSSSGKSFRSWERTKRYLIRSTLKVHLLLILEKHITKNLIHILSSRKKLQQRNCSLLLGL